MSPRTPGYRVAFLAGTLVQHGAEKQMVYMAEALHRAGVLVRVYTFGEGEYFEHRLVRSGIPVMPIGTPPGRGRRLARLVRVLREFRPHLVQAGHFYTNLYVTLAARLAGALALGAIRSDTHFDVASTGVLGLPSLRLSPALLANSYAAAANAQQLGVAPARLHVLPNVIDHDESGARLPPDRDEDDRPLILLAARLVPAKRIDRFLRALAEARRQVPTLRGIVIGDGPERERLEGLAQELALGPDALEFREAVTDLRGLLRRVSVLALTSDHEGFPNVVLEAMVAGLPVVTTPAGDSGRVVLDGETGYVVPFDEIRELTGALVRLAQSPELRRRFGLAGAERAHAQYGIAGLGNRLLRIHQAVADQQGRAPVVGLIRPRIMAS